MGDPRLFDVPVRIGEHVKAGQLIAVGPGGIEGVVVNVETYWHLRFDPWFARFAVDLHRRTKARLSNG